MRRTLYWALGLGALVSWPAAAARAQQWFFYPTNTPAAQASAAYPYSVPADFPRPYGPAPQPPQPNAYPYRTGTPNPMPQTIYYPMPNQTMAPAAMLPVQQTVADGVPAPTPLPSAGQPGMPRPVTVQGPVAQDLAAPVVMDPAASMPPGYSHTPASVDAANDVGDEPGPRCGWMAGGGVYLVKPYINDNVAFTADRGPTTTVSGVTGTTTSFARTAGDFEYDLTASPYVWIGYLGEHGFGFRADYFRFDQRASAINTMLTASEIAASPLTISPPASITSSLPPTGLPLTAPTGVLAGDTSGTGADVLNFASSLRLQYFDVEAACDLELGRCWSILITGGGRYLHLDENYLELISGTGVTAFGGPSTERVYLQFGHNFTGGGPTLATQIRWSPANCRLAFFGSARGSLLVGRSSQATFFSDAISDLTGTTTALAQFTDRRDWTLPVAEVEIGVEYALNVNRTRPFFRAGLIDQTYFGIGSASNTNGDLSLFGIDLAFGVDY